ncbi:hypothetical protein NM208_g8872 [Fusarium decemcellulare]|uniref:Uncharacterized protein n=1 Tax=Fusarium decemcellulare TaxID=57161 RepID=A0ACC1S3N9_9HYPO|nr:hypothetical protein NM208_g8872 [Fusarium decemcellulare]
MRANIATLAAGLLSTGVSSLPITASRSSVRELVELPGVWIENVGSRSNGNLLLNTIGDDGQVYSFNPRQSPPNPQVVAQIDGRNALTGIAEVGNDVFAVTSSIVNLDTLTFQNGSMKVSLLDFKNSGGYGTGKSSVKDVLEGTELGPVNGITTLPKHKHIILGADSVRGEIVRIDTSKGTANVAFKDDLLAPGPSGPFELGVNGLKISKGYLYFTNTRRQSYNRVKIDEYGNKAGEVEVIYKVPSTSTSAPDDFVLDKHDNAYVTFWPGMLVKITPEGKHDVLVNGTFNGPTSLVWGKGGHSLYVVTAGRDADGGQVVEVKI